MYKKISATCLDQYWNFCQICRLCGVFSCRVNPISVLLYPTSTMYILVHTHIHSYAYKTYYNYVICIYILCIYIYKFSHANEGSLSSSIFASKRSAWLLSNTKRSKFVFSDSHLRLIKICNKYSYINYKDVCPPRNILSDFIDIKNISSM